MVQGHCPFGHVLPLGALYNYQMCMRATVSLSSNVYEGNGQIVSPRQELLLEGVSPRASVLVEGLTD